MSFTIKNQTDKPQDLSVEQVEKKFDQLPDNVVLTILSNLNFSDLACISQSNKRLYKLVNKHGNSSDQINQAALPIRSLEAAKDFACLKMDILDKHLN